ncbi:uncharacterized protein BXIN_1375 [Babesia sp. Xinjiang]|uniref:uncharacterized protein n=1 Tax=Babesia sp. Xinjiang TaxID=462227 RepID=UPI000A235A95|nr:uncharacterized protein BXIN_1375 [Babesia sp. Xinjiang]ORM40226.1 hypothetical protein BXIN_1375 [Babesia sp. Xinjiang]
MAFNPPDYLSIPGGDGSVPASQSMRNPLLRPLEGSELGATFLKHQEVSSFLKGAQPGRMVGEVLGMCPAKEIRQKLEMNTASDLERASSSKINPRLALKSFQRSDASKVFKPEETRPAVWCRRTIFNILCYYVDADLIRKPYLMSKNFSYLDVYNFLRDRLRSIWQDLTVQHCAKHRAYIECFEISIRFLIYSNEVLCENEEYDIAQNRGLMNTCLDKLMEGYEAVHKYKTLRQSKRHTALCSDKYPNYNEVMDVLVYSSPHEPEFWGYRLLMHIPQLLLPGGSATFCDIRQRMPPELRENALVRFAIEVCHSAAAGNLYRYFTLMRAEECPALYAALMNRFAICLRVQFLETLVTRKIAKRHVNPLDIDTFNALFGFEGEPPSNAEKMLTKYDITVYSTDDKKFLDLETVNANQLGYDRALLQKLTNKFQTSSSIVRGKLDSFESRQLVFDPDFEYPAGTGPDTCGTPFVPEEPVEKAPVTTTSPNIAGFGMGTFQGFKPLPIPGGNNMAIPATGFMSKVTPSGFEAPVFGTSGFAFGSASTNTESKPFTLFGFSTPVTEVKPATTDTTPQKTFGNIFGTASSITNVNPFAAVSTVDGKSPVKPFSFGPIFGTVAKDSNPFAFTPPSGSSGFDVNPFGAVSTSPDVAVKQSVATLSTNEDGDTPKPFSFLQSKPIGSEGIMPLFSPPVQEAATKQPPLPLFSIPKNDDIAKPADDRVQPSENIDSVEPISKSRVPTVSETEKTEPPLFPSVALDTNDDQSTPVVSSSGTTGLFGVPKVTFGIPESKSGHKDKPETLSAVSKPLPAPKPTTTAKKLVVSITQPVVESVMKRYQRYKSLKHVKVKKPKVSRDINVARISGTSQLPSGYRVLSNFRAIVASIIKSVLGGGKVSSSQDERPLNSCVSNPHTKRRCRRSIMSPTSDADESLKGSENVEMLSAVPRVQFQNYTSELSLRDVSTHRGLDVIYLNRRGSQRFLMKRYVDHLLDRGIMRIITPCYTCVSCCEGSDTDLFKILNSLGYTSVKVTLRLCRVLGFVIRRTARMTKAVATYIGKRLRDKDDYSIVASATDALGDLSYMDVYRVTDGAFKELASSTRAQALATGRYIASVYDGSSRLLNRITDFVNRSKEDSSYPLESLLRMTIEHIGDLSKGTHAALVETVNNSNKVHDRDIWAAGILWHVSFFNPLALRSELVASGYNGDNDTFAEDLISRYIADYQVSDYALRLKEDVLHMAGFDMAADRLLPGIVGYKRSMVHCCSAKAIETRTKKGDVKCSSLPVAVLASVSVNDDSGDSQRLCHEYRGSRSSSMPSDRCGYRFYRNVYAIGDDDLRCNNTVSIALYALSKPVYIGRSDFFRDMFTREMVPDMSMQRVELCSIDCYGIISTLMHSSGPELGGHYQTCLVCYRLSVSQLDLLMLYEYFNTSLPNTVSICGCADKNHDLCATRVRQTISSVSELMLTEVINYASKLKATIDASLLRSRVVFSCVGFELHQDECDDFAMENDTSDNRSSKADVCQGPQLIPRMLYSEGFSEGMFDAAETTLRSQGCFVLQKPFEIPDIHDFLVNEMRRSTAVADQVPVCPKVILRDSLDELISRVELNFGRSHWDIFNVSGVVQDVSVMEDFGLDTRSLCEYSKDSFLTLLQLFKAASEHSDDTSCESILASRVLSAVIIRRYYVPYIIGLLMSTTYGH